MSQAGYTPISLYYSTTASAVPTSGNLANGELAINIVDEKLYFKNSAGTVKLLASNATSAPVLSFQTSLSGLTPSTATSGVVTLAGTLGVASGGTGLTAGTSGGILGYTATGTLASSVALTANALVLGAGAGATPTPMASLGTTTTVLHGNASGAPTFGAVSLTADVTGTLPTANGGTNLTSFTSGGVVYASSSSALATGSALVFDGTNLGMGVTPTTGWYSLIRANQTLSASFAGLTTGTSYVTYVGSNWFVNSVAADKYIANGFASLYTQASGQHQWSTAGNNASGAGAPLTFTQAMTLDASGNLLVGDTSAYSGSRLSVKTGNNNGTTHAWYAKNSSATLLGYQRDDGLFNTGAATNSPYNFTTATAANLFVDASGTFYRSTSSLKYKTNVQNATHGLADILKLRSVTYKGKNDGDKVYGGLIAEEIHEAGLTEFVQYAEDGSPDALAYGNMVSLCIKAIQEMKAIIDTQASTITQLQADVAALKGA